MTTVAAQDAVARHRIRVMGVVQGVGFRPFVHRLATEIGLSGHVGNDTEGVFVEVEGATQRLEHFEARLVADAPPLARIYTVDVTPIAPEYDDQFRIVSSIVEKAVRTFVSPDVAVCDDCLGEMFNPSDHRFRYPFINCTNCGPRFTITIRLPYDRPNTTMAAFDMCAVCEAEYVNPSDRRYHAQPVACATCGPRLRFEGRDETVEGTDAAVAAVHNSLARGDVVAIKGLGGYHLACDATSEDAVARLRERKQRMDRPLAVMVCDLDEARSLAHIDAVEAALLCAPQRPILLLDRRASSPLSQLVAPHNPQVGLLLPYTPLHHLLFHPVPGQKTPVPSMIVMTSGNLTDEPICHEDDDARRRLGQIADSWLTHDRPIHVPCDDSVLRVDDGEAIPIRRSRGYTPLPVAMPFASTSVLATGGELKNAFCLAQGRHAWISQHIGDMGSVETLTAFARSVGQFGEMYQIEPAVVAADQHPAYQTRRWADECSDRPVELIQHHHAHVASLMVEHAVPPGERVIGFAFDGTGYGTDGAIWGGEVLVAGYDSFERAAHLRYIPLPGGDAAVRRPYRAALAHLWAAGIEWTPNLPPVDHAPDEELMVLQRQLERSVQCVPTSSMGRLFDAVSSFLGVRHTATYEAQAAIELEWLASHHLDAARQYQFGVTGDQLEAAPVWHGLVRDLRLGCPIGPMAAGFHLAVARLIADMAAATRRSTGISTVALTGGVFQNAVLARLARRALVERGMTVLTHRLVPTNDAGLALGQAAIAGYGVELERGAR
jgi:hydrogenase maturation protein HypF